MSCISQYFGHAIVINANIINAIVINAEHANILLKKFKEANRQG